MPADQTRRKTTGLSITQQQRLFDALKKIARGYVSPAQLQRNAERLGLSYEETIEMAYENIQAHAAAAIKGVRRPKGEANAR
jgi:hypothetical protein